MNLRDLTYLVTLAEEGHFGRAAEICHVSQPTLSAQLRKLEDTLGVQLVERLSRKSMLTPIGKQVVGHARQVLEEVEAIRNVARDAQDPLAGRFTLGVIPTLGPYLLPLAMGALRTAFPLLKLFLREDLTGRLVEALAAGAIDAALLALPAEGDGLESLPIFDEPFVLAVPPDHPLASHAAIREHDLENQAMLLLEDGHCLRDQALSLCERRGARERDDFRATSLETLRQMVSAGIGGTLLPALAAHTGGVPDPSIVIRPFAGRPPTRTIGMIWRKGSARGRAAGKLAAVIRGAIPAEMAELAMGAPLGQGGD